MLACELALGGVKVLLLEKRTALPNITRAFAVHARTLELLDARGLADEVLDRGIPVHELAPPGGASLDLRELPTRYGMVLIVPQSGVEQALTARAAELGVDVVHGVEVSGLAQDDDGVTIGLAGGEMVRAQYAVGCDGAHSLIRLLAGIDFVGAQYQTHILLADVRLAQPPGEAMFARTNGQGAVIVVPFGDGWFRAIAWDRSREQAPLDEPVSEDEIRDAFGRIAGGDFGMSDMRWSSRFLSERRQSRHYRADRVFLAGDAAHVHSPLGGQGMNTGIGDAMNLGWKLAAAVRGRAPDWLLDTYESERHPVGAGVLKLTDAFNRLVLGRSAMRRAAQGFAVATVLRIPRTRRLMAERISGLGITYPRLPGDDVTVGRRMPDVNCDGTRTYELLRAGKFLLLSATEIPLDRPDVIRALEVDPSLPEAEAVLVRPDGYVAWARHRVQGATELSTAVDCWCGPRPGA